MRMVWLAAMGIAGSALAQAPVPDGDLERVYYDAVDADGKLSGGMLMMPRPDLGGVVPVGAAPVTTILDNGPPANRIDLVFVGDGYTAAQLPAYAAHAVNALNALLSQEPFLSYSTYFNAHRVDVVSNESGVDNDPVQGILKDTALDMAFWCDGVERLLCINVTAAYAYAFAAPGVQQVIAIANSTKYGGAGYTSSELATLAGGNFFAPEIAIHEMGHSMGDLADEYDYGAGPVYSGPERPERNISILDAPEMAAAGTKWASWLGDPGFGYAGLVSTFEGAYYCQFGINRPTFDSKMRSLGVPFNLPSAESLVIQMYVLIDPIDAASPNGTALTGTETLFVDPIDPVGQPLDTQWRLNGAPIPGATGETFDVGSLGLGPGDWVVSVKVTDNTPLVRDEALRQTYLSQTINWSVPIHSPGDVNGDFHVDTLDFLYVLAFWGPCAGSCPPSCFGDVDGDCGVGVLDLLIVLANWS